MTIYLAPSIWRSMDPRTASAAFASIAGNPTDERIIWEPLWNDALISRSRSLLATRFVERYPEADVMAIFDDDMVWNPDDLWKLVEGARESRGIYCGLFVTRSDKPHLSSRLWPDTDLNIIATPQRRPIDVQYAATGFVAIHRAVFEQMSTAEFRDADGTHRLHRVELGGPEPFVPWFSPFTIHADGGRYHYLSEDWAFCERAQQLGIPVQADQSIILQHMGWYPFTVGDLERPTSEHPSTGTDLVEFGSHATDTGEPLLDNLIADIAEYTEEEIGDARRLIHAGTAKLAELWRSRTEGEAAWYEREDVGLAYIGDLAAWHLRGGSPLSLVPQMAGKRVLDFGAGIGTLAIAMARAGAYVSIMETNPVLDDFAHWRAGRCGLRFAPTYESAPFDAIVAWHVFEHLENPESVLDRLLFWLRPGGQLITQSDFHVDADHPMHHVRDDWEDVLASRGLRSVGDNVYEYVREAVPA